MKRFVLFVSKRLAWSIFVLFGVSVLIFCIARIIPGDPVELALGARATQEAKQLFIEKNHLDEPVYVQYYYWLTHAIRGDFGNSTLTRRPVSTDLTEFLPATLELVLFAAMLEIIMGFLLGILSARYPGKWIDNVTKTVSYLGIATPPFVWAVLLMLVFAYFIPILPAIGRISVFIDSPASITGFLLIDSLIAGNLPAFFDVLKHLLMPGIALASTGIASAARITRTSILENISKDYVNAEIAAGIPMRRIMFGYVLRPSAISTISVIGMDMAAMIGNAFAVELIFGYPGFSRYGLKALLNVDLNAIVAVVLVIGIAFLLVNLLVDIIAGLLDPRILMQGGRR